MTTLNSDTNVSPTAGRGPEARPVHGPIQDEEASSPSNESNQDSQDNLVTGKKQATAIVTDNVYRHDSSDSEDLSSTPQSSWKARAMQFELLKDITSRVSQPRNPRTWKTTWIRFGPLSGVFCMLLAIASIVSSLGILAGSDGQPVASWSVPPSTYLAIFTAIANLSMRYAAIQGVVIAWWYKALSGSTLGKLHWDWRSGTTVRGALTAGRHMGLLGLACIFSTVVVIDGPLLQRSTSVVAAPILDQSVTLNITMSPELPAGFSGGWFDPAPDSPYAWPYAFQFNETIPTPDGTASNYVTPLAQPELMADLTQRWFDDSPLLGVAKGCSKRNCKAKIQAPALFPTTCTSESTPINYFNGNPDASTNLNQKSIAPPFEQDAFIIAINLVPDQREVINLITAYSTVDQCVGHLNTTICTLEPGIGEYDIVVQHDVVEIADNAAKSPKMVNLSKNNAVAPWDPWFAWHDSTLAGIVALAYTRWTAVAYYQPAGGNLTVLEASGAPVKTEYVNVESGQYCEGFRDPQEDVLESLNKLMFYFGAYIAHHPPPKNYTMDPGLSWESSVTGSIVGSQNEYHSDYWFFLGAAIVEIVCIALVAPTYWGWWKIGRPVSFSPLETAKAFESPMFRECNSNSSGRDLAKAVGEQKVQYGVASSEEKGEATKLAFADPSSTANPTTGSRFDV